MPYIDKNFLELLQCDYKTYKNFIETGTFMGQTIFSVEPYFDTLYTIEIKKEFYDHCKRLYRGNKINFILGDSSISLKYLLQTINDKSIIFLDGHWSNNNTGRGEKDCPLYEEIENIKSFHKNDAIIIIDDVRLFGTCPKNGTGSEDYEDINIDNVLKILNERVDKYYYLPSELHPQDRCIVHIKKINY